MEKIAITYGENRELNIKKSLEFLSDEIREKLKNKSTILIKPNLVSTKVQLSATHKDAIKGLLNFLIENNLTDKKVIIAEGSAIGETENGFENFGYYELKEIFPDLQFLDLNKEESYEIEIYDRRLNLVKIKSAKIMIKKLNPDIFYVSICPAKTHDTVIVTLSIKNIVVGSLQDDKEKIHQGYRAINLTLAKVYQEHISPDLAIIDAFEAMEGDGPVDGTAVKMNLALSGLNAVYVDALMSYLMGVEPYKIGYLYHLGIREDFLSKIEIIGEDIEKHKRKFKLHSTANYQFNWK